MTKDLITRAREALEGLELSTDMRDEIDALAVLECMSVDLARLALAAEELARLLRIYREKTPLGHQPHMIAGKADAALTAFEAIAKGEQP